MEAETIPVNTADSPRHSPDRQTGHRGTVSAACVPCRSKHLKCDGLRLCSRCASQGLQCTYLKSRRGYKGLARSREHSNAMEDKDNGEGPSSGSQDRAMPSTDADLLQTAISSSLDLEVTAQNWDTRHPSSYPAGMSIGRRCMEAFFKYFYDSHPFLPPRQQFLELLKASPMDYLETAIAYIGARYIPGASPASFTLELGSFVSRHDFPRDASTVQTMLLFALGLDGNGERKEAVGVLIKAQRLALELGMNQREYAILNGKGSVVCEESLRRTWWELYVVSVMVAAFHGRAALQLFGIIVTTPLPCEEKDFLNGCIPRPHTIDEFDDSSFLEEEIEWSSFAYRIAATRNLERILQIDNIMFPEDPRLFNLDAYLVNWTFHLPPSKTTHFDHSGTFDEMIFQGHMITSLSSLILHRRFSKLDGPAAQTITQCTDPSTEIHRCLDAHELHSSKMAEAASSISKLVGLPTDLTRHTHFFICALTLSSISHLSHWSTLPLMTADNDLREEIRLNAGALRMMRTVWPVAQIVFGQVTAAARKIFEMRKDAVGEVFWRDLIGEGDGVGNLDLEGLETDLTDVNS